MGKARGSFVALNLAKEIMNGAEKVTITKLSIRRYRGFTLSAKILVNTPKKKNDRNLKVDRAVNFDIYSK